MDKRADVLFKPLDRLEEIDLSQGEAAQESYNGVKPSANGFYSVKKEYSLDSVFIYGDSVAPNIHV